MKLLVEPFGVGRRTALIAGAVTFAMLALLAIAARAQATETIYWDNYRDSPATIGSADITGSGGGLLNLGGIEFETTEGMAYDPVTNRLYVAVEAREASEVLEEGAIAVINLDGSGASFFSAPGLSAKAPEGIVLDPATRTMYWDNTADDTIGWAKLDGSAAGLVNTAGAPTEDYYRLALDPASGRLYWSAEVESEEVIAWANVNNTGGGVLPVSGEIKGADGMATDPLNSRLYMIAGNTTGTLSSVGLDGGAVETVPLGATFHSGYGLAIDPVAGTAFWGNYGIEKSRTETIGFSSLSGTQSGAISPTTTPANGAQDPVIVRSPTAAGAPRITQSNAVLSCSQGTWAPDYPGAFVYQAPVSYTYQWLLNGRPIAGATGSSYAATASGSYACTVTGTNHSGSASQTSAATTVAIVHPQPIVAPTPAALTLKPGKKKAVKVAAGKVAVVKIDIVNGGGTASGAVKVCAKLGKKAKKGLKTPKCVPVASVPAGGSVVAKLKVKTKKSAKGVYKFTVQVKGAAVKSITAKVHVVPAKHKKHKQQK